MEIPEIPNTYTKVRDLGLTPGRYVLQVSRLVPEKRQLDLIRAFTIAAPEGWKLALVGTIDQANRFAQEVVSAAEENHNIVVTGFQQGLALRELFGHAGMFVLPSSHEGLPIALLEALSFGLPVIASDIPANLELGLPEENYFSLGDTDELAQRIRDFVIDVPQSEHVERVQQLRRWLAERYDWQVIAKKTCTVYAMATGENFFDEAV